MKIKHNPLIKIALFAFILTLPGYSLASKVMKTPRMQLHIRYQSDASADDAFSQHTMHRLITGQYRYQWHVSQAAITAANGATTGAIKLASRYGHWGACKSAQRLVEDTPYKLCRNSGLTVPLAVERAGSYTFTVKHLAHKNPTLTMTYHRPSGFIRGADISTLASVEALGGRCYEHQQPHDCLQILRHHGFNYVRLRLWNDPYDSNGVSYGGGNDNLWTVMRLAQRAKMRGYKILLDFHYSDFWVDPGKQVKPKAWQDLDLAELTSAVHDYTLQVMLLLKIAGAEPDMVQIGNEINGGMLWPEGRSYGGDGQEFDHLAQLIQAGSRAVREVNGHHTRIMLHLAEGGNNSTFRWWFDEITERNVDFDIIGMSYYPYWHGTLDALQTNMEDMISRYHKDVMIAETAYGFTTDNGDSLANNFSENEAETAGYPATPAGQAAFISDLMDRVAALPDHHGLGIFYWEPAWLPVGVSWATPAGMQYSGDEGSVGNAWENQALFDFDGNVLDSIHVFE